MNAKQTAMQYADQVLSLIPQLIHQAVEERRQHACWYEAYRRRRLALCNPAMRPMWRLLVRISAAKCAANKEMAQACRMATAQVRMEQRA
jgi:hypothetical protein